MSLDAYYTAPDRACQLVGDLSALISNIDLFIEPSAGEGAFLEPLPSNTIALDVDPHAPGIIVADFLDWQPPEGFDRIAVVGNPPFGTVGNKARLFFNHAATFADYIAFIMPASFAKPSMQAALDHQIQLLHQQDLLDEPLHWMARFIASIRSFRCGRGGRRSA